MGLNIDVFQRSFEIFIKVIVYFKDQKMKTIMFDCNRKEVSYKLHKLKHTLVFY